MSSNFYNPRTHNAFGYKREGRRLQFGRWVEIGSSRIEQAPCPHCGAVAGESRGHVFLDRLPVGGFSGYVLLTPFGTTLPRLTSQQMQLIEQGGKDSDEEEEEDSEPGPQRPRSMPVS